MFSVFCLTEQICFLGSLEGNFFLDPNFTFWVDLHSLKRTAKAQSHPKKETSTPWKFNSLPLKNGGWKTTFLLGWSIFRGYVKLRGGIPTIHFQVLLLLVSGSVILAKSVIAPYPIPQHLSPLKFPAKKAARSHIPSSKLT